GGALSVNVIADPVSAHLDNSTFTSTKGSLTVHAESDDTIGAGTVGVAGSASGKAVGGSVSVNVIANTTKAYIGDSHDNTPSHVTTDGAVEVSAKDQSLIVSVAGGVGISLESNAVGAALSGNVITNTTDAHIYNATVHTYSSPVTAAGTGSTLLVSAQENS